MPKKLNYLDVKKYIKDNNCMLLSITYQNNNTPLRIKCSCGEIFNRNLRDFKASKKVCNKCSGSYVLSYKEVKDYITKHNCTLLTLKSQYRTTEVSLKIKCSCNNIFYRTFRGFKTAKTCPECSNVLSYSTIKNTINKTGCTLLTSKSQYKTTNHLLRIKCHCGNIFNQLYHPFLKTKQCSDCNNIHFYSYKEVKDYITKTGCTLLTSKLQYKNASTKLKIKCVCNKTYYRTFNKLKQVKALCKDCSKKYYKIHL